MLDFITEKVTIFAPNEDVDFQDQSNVIRSWNLDNNSQNLDFLYSQILNNRITTIILQFNYGFFEFSHLSKFLQKISKKNIRIIIFLHSTINPKNRLDKSLYNLRESFAMCDRLLVHTPSDLNRLRQIGLGMNSYIFPHGILDFDQLNDMNVNTCVKSLNNSKINIATYGFCLPNKGYKELIHAIKILKNINLNINLTLYSAIHSSRSSILHVEELKALINELELNKCITIDSYYYSDSETLKNLSKQDLIIFPYQSSNESSSASVRHGLAAGPSVLVTPVPIFDDLKNVVQTLPGISPADIADGIKSWLENINDKQNIDKSVKADHWRKQHRFSLLGRRLQGLVKGLEINQDFL